MRTRVSAIRLARRGGALRRALGGLREVALWAAAIGFLESWGSLTPHDGADILGLAAAISLGALFTRLVALGWMPATGHVGRRAGRVGRRMLGTVTPQHALVLRVHPDRPPPEPDRTLLGPALLITILIGAALATGDGLLAGLLYLKHHVSYLLYLLGLGLVWGLLGTVAVLGVLASVGRPDRRGRTPGRSALRLLAFTAAWAGALLAVAALPGLVPLGAVFAIAFVHGGALRRQPVVTYLLCRHDAAGTLRGIAVHDYLRRFHGVVLLILLLATAVAQSPRLLAPEPPGGPFAVTGTLALLASAAAVYLAAKAGTHFLRFLARPGEMPETPLVPTLWLPAVREAPPYAVAAAGRGWKVAPTAIPPPEGFDLVVGEPDDPASFAPREGVSPAEQQFLLERRFHVVKRRQFWRRFHGLWKEVVSRPVEGGSGFLFCPHIWLVPGLVRDAEGPRRGERTPGALLAARIHGRPYAQVFPTRLRRYLGGVLRDLRIDLVFWEDGVPWTAVRQVLGVAFEVHDQGRAPLEERHFAGLARVRVVIQDEEEGDPGDGGAAGEGSEGTPPSPPSLKARVLLILKDRGGHEEEVAPPPGGTRRRQPVPV